MEDSLEDYLKLSSNVTETQQLKITRTQITADIKRQFQAKAQKLIEFSIDGKLRPETFQKCLLYLTRDNYQDIIEERSITNLCGYPLCGLQIPEMPQKRYHISARSNKIYDINERKNFCSNFCYTASSHVRDQIDLNPVWSRNFKHLKPIEFLLYNENTGQPGEELDYGPISSQNDNDISFTSVSDFTEYSLEEMDRNEKRTVNPPKPIQMPSIDEELPEEVDPLPLDNQIPIPLHTKTIQQQENVEELVEKHVKLWISLETLIFLHGERKIREVLDESALCEYFDTLKVSDMDVSQQHRFVEICKKIHFRPDLEPVPDFRKLRQDFNKLQIKVRSFYGSGTSTVPIIENKEENDDTPYVIPIGHSSSTQNAMRRKIFLNSLNKTLHMILDLLRLNSVEILAEIRDLVKTFRLTSENVVFKPIVGNCIAVILLKMLSVKNESLRQCFMHVETSKKLEPYLKSLSNNGDRVLNVILTLLNDISAATRTIITSKS